MLESSNKSCIYLTVRYSVGMNRTNSLNGAQVVGFFSLPSASLAEHNPDAYNNAMADAPQGAGTCWNCGMGIRHHVVVKTEDGQTHFIGSDCAQRIGDESVRACVANRLTSTQLYERKAKHDASRAEFYAFEARSAEMIAQRTERFSDVLAALKLQGTSFHLSLAEQLVRGSLSYKQSNYVLKAVFGRENKRNSEAYCKLADDLREENSQYAL